VVYPLGDRTRTHGVRPCPRVEEGVRHYVGLRTLPDEGGRTDHDRDPGQKKHYVLFRSVTNVDFIVKIISNGLSQIDLCNKMKYKELGTQQ